MSKHNDYYQIELLKTIGWGLIILGLVGSGLLVVAIAQGYL